MEKGLDILQETNDSGFMQNTVVTRWVVGRHFEKELYPRVIDEDMDPAWLGSETYRNNFCSREEAEEWLKGRVSHLTQKEIDEYFVAKLNVSIGFFDIPLKGAKESDPGSPMSAAVAAEPDEFEGISLVEEVEGE
jgi:hypothetical protein